MRYFLLVLSGWLSVLGCIILIAVSPGRAEDKDAGRTRVVRKFSLEEKDSVFNPAFFIFSPEVVQDRWNKAVRLARSVLVTDEIGATDWHQTETLSAQVWAKKVLVVDLGNETQDELFVFGTVKEVEINGKKLRESKPLVSTGWTRVPVPSGWLVDGENEVVFKGGGSLLIDPSRPSGRSSKSSDKGKTWSTRTLGAKNNLQGEYLVRLRHHGYAPRGWAMTGVIDLWAVSPGAVATPATLHSIEKMPRLQDPKAKPPKPVWNDQRRPGRKPIGNSRLVGWSRTGGTPVPDEINWTQWHRLDQAYSPAKSATRHRWAQLKFELIGDPFSSPRLPPSFELIYWLRPDNGVHKDKLEVIDPEKRVSPGRPALGSVPFVYQAPSPRLKHLREKYQLDKVIAPGKSEMEQLMLLRYWVRNQWHTAWGSHPAAWMPPWDALVILANKDQPDCLTMCTHYAAVFTQCCVALGWNARHCILDHHCTAEVYVNAHNKWVMMDAGNSAERSDVGLHFERKGIPLSALELHVAQKTGKTKDITVHFTPAKLVAKIAPLCRPAPAAKTKPASRPDVVPAADLGKYPVCGLNNYRRYAFPARNNYLDSLYPGELYQGWSEYYYDGYWWVGDSRDDPKISPEYSRHLTPDRPQDIDWSLNWTRIHLARTAKAGEVHVDLETMTPNLARLEMTGKAGQVGPKDWKPTAARFVWRLQPGVNVLRVRSLNKFDRAGVEAKVEVKWTPAAR
jgi:hypothetical protein